MKDMKEAIVHRNVLNSILKLEVAKGHLKWKVSDVARASKVSRPLIYYHFGKTKKAILESCILLIGEEYYGLGKDREHSLVNGSLLESLKKTRAMFLANPALAAFYQRWRMEDSPYRAPLIKMEKRYQNKVRKAFPRMSQGQVLSFHAMLHGLITAPFLDEEAFEEAAGVVLGWLKSVAGAAPSAKKSG